MTLMDLMTSDPKAVLPSSSSSSSSSTPAPSSSSQMAASPTRPPPTSLGKPVTDRKSKRTTLLQIQNDTISAAKAVRANIMPQKQKKRVYFFPYISNFGSVVVLSNSCFVTIDFLMDGAGHI